MGILEIGQRVNGKSSAAAEICSAADGNLTVVVFYRNTDTGPGLEIFGQTAQRIRIEAAAAVPTVFASTSFFTSCSIPSTPSSNGMFSSSSSISPFPFTESPAAGAGFLPVKLLVTERLFRERVFWASISRFPHRS